MKKSFIRKALTLCLVSAAGLSSTGALATNVTYYYFNDGNGNCGYVSCGPYGCAPVIRFPCPREVSGD
jgi:hypothetical protein